MTDKRQRCKLCGAQHRLDQAHAYGESFVMPPPAPESFVTPLGRPRKHPTNAERQRAYRERKR